MKTLGLVSCTKRKQKYPCKASEMYSASDLFRKAYAYCNRNYDQVAILSAKYGLLLPEDKIKPYDLTLNKMRVSEIRKWSEKVFNQIQKCLDLKEIYVVFFHAGVKYRKFIIPKLEAFGIEYRVPLKNLGIGNQLSWYNKKNC